MTDWLDDHRPDMKHVARIVDALNPKLVQRLGPHLQVGPSQFFRDDLCAETLEEIWRHDIMPFLQDQLYGHEDELSEFELASLIEETGADAESGGMAADRRAARKLFAGAVRALERNILPRAGARQRLEPRWVATTFGRGPGVAVPGEGRRRNDVPPPG